MRVCVYPEERGCEGLPLNGSQVQHSPFSPPEPGFLRGFACEEGISRGNEVRPTPFNVFTGETPGTCVRVSKAARGGGERGRPSCVMLLRHHTTSATDTSVRNPQN